MNRHRSHRLCSSRLSSRRLGCASSRVRLRTAFALGSRKSRAWPTTARRRTCRCRLASTRRPATLATPARTARPSERCDNSPTPFSDSSRSSRSSRSWKRSSISFAVASPAVCRPRPGCIWRIFSVSCASLDQAMRRRESRRP